MVGKIRKISKGIFGFIVLGSICLAMLGFGTDFLLSGRNDNYAIKIGEKEVSFDRLTEVETSMRNNLQQRLGDDFWKMIGALNINFRQQAIDRIIRDEVVNEKIETTGLAVGDRKVASTIQSIFDGNFSRSAYAQYLSQIGLTANQFEAQLRKELLSDEFNGLVGDLATVTDREVRALIQQQETKYDIDYIKIEAKNYNEKLPEVSPSVLEGYYNEKAMQYEQPAAVSYKYVIFPANKFIDQVNVSQEDLEMYYLDNENNYLNKEKAKLKAIRILYTKDSSPEAMSKVKERAQDIYNKAMSGASFEGLVAAYSEDIFSKVKGGDIGWREKGEDSDYDKIFQSKKTGIAELVSTEKGFEIINVEEFDEAKPKPLSEVKDEIEGKLKETMAPIIAREKADSAAMQLTNNKDAVIETFARPYMLEIVPTDGMLSENQDPSELTGLTKIVLENIYDTYQVVELNDTTILVEVRDHREAFVPKFNELEAQLPEVYAKLKSDYQAQEALKMAKSEAEKLAEELRSGKYPNMHEAAVARGLESREARDISKAGTVPSDLKNSNIERAIFSLHKAGEFSQNAITADNDFYLLQLVNITAPSEEVYKEKWNQYKEQADSNSAMTLQETLYARFKAATEIDINVGSSGE